MKTPAEYTATSNRCPRCNSSDIEAGNMDIDTGSAGQEVSCNPCGLAWWDEYELTGYTLKHAPPWPAPPLAEQLTRHLSEEEAAERGKA